VTLDPGTPTAQAVAVMDGKILGAGTLDEVRGWITNQGFEIDRRFQDAVIVPGFIEPHMHPQFAGVLWQGAYIGRLDRISPDGVRVTGLATKRAVIERLREAAAKLPDNGKWLIAWGYQPEFYDNAPLTRADLDPISNGHPMFIENLSMHIYYANSKAFEIAGIPDNTGIVGIVKQDGEPTGEIKEIPAALTFFAKLPLLDGKVLLKATWDAAKLAHRTGVTTFADLSFGFIPGGYKAYQAAAADPDFPVRIVLNPLINIFQTGEIADKGGLDYLAELHKADNDRLNFGGVKFVVDGSIQGYTALLLWPGYYKTFANGVANMSQENLNKWILEVRKRGYQAVLHTNGNLATEMALEALSEAQRQYPRVGTRHRLEHNQFATQSQLIRMKALGLATDFFTNHIYYWGDLHYATFVGPDRARRIDPAGSAQRMGIPFSLHSDDSVTPVDPLFSMWTATARKTSSGRVLGEDERISIAQALHAVTLGAAYLLHQDDKKGSIQSGKLADFTILDRNPLDVGSPDELKDIKVLGRQSFPSEWDTMTSKSREAIAQEVLTSARFDTELTALADKIGRPLSEARKEAYTALRAMVSMHNPFFGFLFARGLGPLHARAWSLDVDWAALKRLQQENANKSLVFLPTHRSYADPYILAKVLRATGLPHTFILSGDNLQFFPVGTIARRAGAIFIRRSFRDDEIYKLALREYIRYLVASRANLEWYMEGGRSRTGKLRRPRYGLLHYLVEATDSGGAEDILLVPVSTTYHQLHEVGKLAAEEAGVAKTREGLRWLAGYARAQGKKLGKAYVRFGEPFSLRQARPPGDNEPQRWSLDKIAFEIFWRINQITLVTAPALVTLTLLSVRDHALTLREVQNVIEPLLDYVAQRSLPTTALGELYAARGVENVLDTLVQSGVVGRHDGGLAPVFFINPGQHAVAAFYRNSAIHWFVNRAIVELGVMLGSRAGVGDAIDRVREAAFALRDLLKFEFVFSEKPVFLEEITVEAGLLDAHMREHMAARTAGLPILRRAPVLMAHRVLPAFLEAYFIVADRLAAHPADAPVDERKFLARCSTVGRQYVLQKRLRNPECVSRELFGNALALAANRGLLQPGADDLMEKRRRFAEETEAAVSGVAAIGELDYQLRHGAQGRG
jgi:glycerol-3-phosphate O-acyltransferase